MYHKKDENLLRLTRKIRENPQRFMFIVGAGMSRPSGMPSWKELADGMIDYYEQIFQNDGDAIKAAAKRLHSLDNLWDVFSELKVSLPENEYDSYIKKQLSVKGRSVPASYKLIWNLDVCGVISFNIDKLILNAYSSVYQSAVDYATRKEFFKYNHFPVSNEKFVFFPHGEISDSSSWVFTESEKKEAYKDEDFKNIFTSLINSKNLVIIGFNPREYSFLSLLNSISIGTKISGYDNYYIGDSITSADRRKLGNYGISCISYEPEDERHSDIENMLKSMLAYVPKDTEYPSVYQGKRYGEGDIPKYEECSSIGLDKLRDILNGNIANILPDNVVPTDEQMVELQKFYQKYSAQLYAAWFVYPGSDVGGVLHGYHLASTIGRGAFGNVYEAYNDKPELFTEQYLN